MTEPTLSPTTAGSEHPSLDVWEEQLFQHDHVADEALQAHLRECPTCLELVARLRAWRTATHQPVTTSVTDGEGHGLRTRILASRAQGVRTLVPTLVPTEAATTKPHDVLPAVAVATHGPVGGAPRAHTPWWRRSPWRAAAALVALIGAASVMRVPPAADAGMVAGTLELMPARPRLGDTIRVTYTAAGLFGTPPVLHLRARLRTASGTGRDTYTPVVTVATLVRTAVNRYEGRFVLPDSVVYAALAVEDTAATVYDDFGGRNWELLRSDERDVPLPGALDQRHNDLMGRSWEALLATAQERVRLYPDSVDAWYSLQFVQNSMRVLDDSLMRVHKAQAQRLSAAMLAGSLPLQPGRMYWYASSVRDTLLAGQWLTRLLRDFPADEFAVQERAIRLYNAFTTTKDTATALATIERLWADTPPERRDQISQVALALLGPSPAYAPHMLRWTQRYRTVDSTAYRRQWFARQLATIPTLRDTAIAQLSALASELAAPDERLRALNETREQFARRMAGERVLTEAILGKVLVLVGRSAEALPRLRTLPDVGWNPDVYEAIAAAAVAAGDTALAVPHWSRLVLDPRTRVARTATLDSLGRRYAGAAAWERLKQQTRTEMAVAMMREARYRKVAPATVMSLDGRATTLTAVANGRPMVVIMFSPLCGPAIEALPAMQQMVARLQAQGVAVALVAEQERANTTLTTALAKANYTGPVFLDASRQANKTLNNWGTPQLYVMDRDGRVVFDPTSNVGETILRVEALLASAPKAAAQEPNR